MCGALLVAIPVAAFVGLVWGVLWYLQQQGRRVEASLVWKRDKDGPLLVAALGDGGVVVLKKSSGERIRDWSFLEGLGWVAPSTDDASDDQEVPIDLEEDAPRVSEKAPTRVYRAVPSKERNRRSVSGVLSGERDAPR